MDWQTESRQKILRHGGRAVLELRWAEPVGERALEKHFCALCAALVAYAEREILPMAAAELEDAVQNGRGYAFRPHRYSITGACQKRRGHLSVTLRAKHTGAGEILFERALTMRWRGDGTLQKRLAWRQRKSPPAP